MVEVCCWERKFDWGGGGGSWCWRTRKFGQAGFLEEAAGCNVAWLVTMGMGLVEVEVVSFVSDFRNESMAPSLCSSHLLDISNDSAFCTIISNCITKENGNLLAY